MILRRVVFCSRSYLRAKKGKGYKNEDKTQHRNEFGKKVTKSKGAIPGKQGELRYFINRKGK